jgi:hypothetical protein
VSRTPSAPKAKEPAGDRRGSWGEAIGTFGPLVTPGLLALTGFLYLGGWSREATLLNNFGLNSSLFEGSVQRTLALGFVPLLFATLVGILITVLTMVITILIEILLAKFEIHFGPPGLKEKWKASYSNTLTVGVTTVALILSIGSGSGWFIGNIEHRIITRDVKGDCSHCIRVQVGSRELVGRIVGQDGDRTALLTRDGLYLFETSKIARVSPLAP